MPCGKLRIRYELLRSLRMRYVSLRNERIVADGLYVSSAESVSVCEWHYISHTLHFYSLFKYLLFDEHARTNLNTCNDG